MLRIYFSGLPSSGNQILKRSVIKWANASDVQVTCHVWHGNPMSKMPDLEPDHIIVPIRDRAIWEISASKRGFLSNHPPDICVQRVAMFALKYALPMRYVSYEGFCQYPNATGRNLAAQLGLKFVPFESGEIVDGNAKHVAELIS